MALTPKGRQVLKARAHKLKPVIMIGNHGLTDAVKKETERALQDHELIKVRVAGADRETRRALIAELCEALQAQLVQSIGNIAVIYRVNVNIE